MGNAKSKKSTFSGHEKLHENNDRYFAKVEARNASKKSARRSKRKDKQSPSVSGGVRTLENSTSIEFEHPAMPAPRVALMESPKKQIQKPIAGPLKENTTIEIPPTFVRSQLKRRQRRHEERSLANLPLNTSLSSPRSEMLRLTGLSPRDSPSQSRLQKSRTTQVGPSSSLSPISMSFSSSHSSRRRVVNDYYTDMIDEAHRESRQVKLTGTKDIARAFDAMLSNGTIWADITRGGKITSLAFSSPRTLTSNALLLAIGTDDGSVAVVEVFDEYPSPINRQIGALGVSGLRKWGPVKELPREGKVRSLHFSPNGRWLAVGGDDCKATLIRIRFENEEDDTEILHSLEVVQEIEREDRVYAVQFSPDGSMLAIGGFDGMLAIASFTPPSNGDIHNITSTPSLELMKEISRLGLVLSVDWSPDGKMLAVGGSDKCCTILDTSWEVIGEIQRAASIPTVKWSPDGTHIAVGSHDGTAVVVDMTSRTISGEVVRGQAKSTPQARFETNTPTNTCRISSLCWSPDGDFLAVGGSDDCCAIVETRNYIIVHEIRRAGHVTCLSWVQRSSLASDGGRFLAVGGDDNCVAILKTGAVARTDESSTFSDTDDVSSSASSSYFSTGSLSQHEWVLKDDSFLDIDDVDPISTECKSPHPVDSHTVGGHDEAMFITAVSFSRNKKMLSSHYAALATSGGMVTIFSTIDWEPITQMTFDKPIDSLHFSRKGDFLALAGECGIVYIVAVANWRIVKEFAASSAIQAVRFSRFDERLAFGSSDGVLTLLDSADWDVIGEIDASESPVLALDWSSKNLALGRDDGTVSVFEAEKVYANFFVPQAELTRGNAPVRSVAFGVSGRFLAVGDDGGKVGVYSSKGGWVLCHQISTAGPILSTRWSASGQYLAFGGLDRTLGARVVDTIAWTNVKELYKLDDGEGLSSLEWSNDDKWLILVCSSGASHVIETTNWTMKKTLNCKKSGCNTAAGGGTTHRALVGPSTVEQTVVPSYPGTTTSNLRNEHKRNETVDATSINVAWEDIPQVARFVNVSEAFLGLHHNYDPPQLIRMMVPCILMLKVHVIWVSTRETDVIEKISMTDDREPLFAVLRILDVASNLMAHVTNRTKARDGFRQSTIKFDLGQRDLRRIQIWNDKWGRVDAESPLMDTNLLRMADETVGKPKDLLS